MRHAITAPHGAWSGGSAAMLLVVAGQLAAATLALHRPLPLGAGAIGLAALSGIAAVVVLARCRMPAPAKAIAIALSCAALLTLVSTQDLLGLRAVTEESGQAVTGAVGTTAPRLPRVAVTGADATGAGAALGPQLERRLAEAGADMDVELALSDQPGFGGVRVRWTLVRAEQRLWCGAYLAESDKPAAFALLGDRVGAAARASRGGALDCA